MAEAVFNIIPVDNFLSDHAALRFPEVRAAIAALQCVGDLAKPPDVRWTSNMDILDWLGGFFGFQRDNVRNQREHLVLLLANAQMRLQPAPLSIDKLEASVVRKIRKKVTQNYVSWCRFVRKPHHLRLLDGKQEVLDERRELLYTSLYLLIWGEAANLRFMPECLCFIFHHMTFELNRMLERFIDELSAQSVRPTYCEPNGFLLRVVLPLYTIVKAEAESNNNGTAPHSWWRNYDDLNEYFWSNRCFTQLQWPLQLDSNFLVEPWKEKVDRHTKQKVGKTGFVEQRSFWNVFRSFDRLWIGYILVLQACIVTLWHGSGPPWVELQKRDSLARFLTIFITWAALRVLQALLDFGMQYSLISRETISIGVRMVLKPLVATGWVIIFTVFYRSMWAQRHRDRSWSTSANNLLIRFLEAAAVFVLPEVLALLLFILPWVRNFVENSSWRVLNLLTWWFQSRTFVGRGLREGVVDNIKYTVFWLLVLASKFAFSYFLQIKPLIKPTKEILQIRNITYKWHEFFAHGNRAAVVALWAPVILIYFMDTQIWYSIWSALVGALVGLFEHLGEIRNVQQLKLRFQIFPSASQFILMPEEVSVTQKMWGGWRAKIKDIFKRFKLRYGWSSPYQKVDSKQIEAGRFSHIWNKIVQIFHEEDLISDRELELLEIPTASWNVSVFQWPSVLLANEILIALGHVTFHHGDDKAVWRKISSSEYRRCAVIESYESIKHVIKRIVRDDTEEHQIFLAIFEEIDTSILQGRFTETFALYELPQIHKSILALLTVLLKRPTPKDLQKVVDALQNLYDVVLRDFPRDAGVQEDIRARAAYPHNNREVLLFTEAVELPDTEDEPFFKQLQRLHTTLSTKEALLNVPRGLEARRRISFFSNSLFMTMPRAPQVDKMLAFSVLTPYYSEEVIYTKQQLREENEDGVSTLFYLQKIFPDDWKNFLERMGKEGLKEKDLWETDDAFQLRMWASYRGQTLARTVRGMMYYERALELQAFLDTASEVEVLGYRELLDRASSMTSEGSFGRLPQNISPSNSDSADSDKKQQELATAAMKFTYVVTCQIYGSQKQKGDNRARDILHLMKTYKSLRIAYIDEVPAGRDSKQYYSVLVKYDPIVQAEVEIYRIMLPGPMKLGEGKPENQNHAIIFTRGDALQTIDMNQEHYFEEAIKMRNLLQEFNQSRGVRKPTILGVREHVFTGSVSSLAWFMSAQETSFVTLGQRVLANPLKVRMHYGHPDVFDRLWFLSRGGISKASRTINISEDIFAGFNCTLRGGTVTHHEYIQAGKGRDVGLNQISLFEAKVASGNGEQVLSRDVYRLGHRLDFFRMLSFYYSTVGFFINNMMIVLTVYSFLYGRVYLALSGVEASITSASNALNNSALTAILNQQLVVQLGLLTALPMVVENALEHGFTRAIWEFCTMQLQLASVFFTFSMGTRTHFFGRTLLHGGAKYRATGRGFVVRHERFAENYRLYSRSHFVKAVELVILLTLYSAYGVATSTATYILVTITSWFLALSWLMAPFIFNPSGFDWLKTVDDYDDFMNWLWYKGGVFVKAEQSWEVWWGEEQSHLRTTGLWGKLLEIVLDLRFFFFQYGIVYQLGIASKNKSILVYLISWSYVFVAGLFHLVLSTANERYAAKRHGLYRLIQALLISLIVVILALLLVLTNLKIVDLLTSLLAFMPTGWAIIQICLVLKTPFLENTRAWGTVVAVARLYELGMALVVMLPVALLSWLPGFQAMQTRILFNEAFSRGLQMTRIVAGKRSSPGL